MRCDGRTRTGLRGNLADDLVLAGVVGREGVDGNHWGDAELLEVFKVLAEVGSAGRDLVGVLGQQFGRERLAWLDRVVSGVCL